MNNHEYGTDFNGTGLPGADLAVRLTALYMQTDQAYGAAHVTIPDEEKERKQRISAACEALIGTMADMALDDVAVRRDLNEYEYGEVLDAEKQMEYPGYGEPSDEEQDAVQRYADRLANIDAGHNSEAFEAFAAFASVVYNDGLKNTLVDIDPGNLDGFKELAETSDMRMVDTGKNGDYGFMLLGTEITRDNAGALLAGMSESFEHQNIDAIMDAIGSNTVSVSLFQRESDAVAERMHSIAADNLQKESAPVDGYENGPSY